MHIMITVAVAVTIYCSDQQLNDARLKPEPRTCHLITPSLHQVLDGNYDMTPVHRRREARNGAYTLGGGAMADLYKHLTLVGHCMHSFAMCFSSSFLSGTLLQCL